MRYAFLVILSFVFLSFTNPKPAYRIFTSEGTPVSYEEMIQVLSNADVVFFGELHDNPIAHWMELEISKELFRLDSQDLILSFEMFETDNQLLLDEYVKGIIPDSKFEAECKLWNNYSTDYKPLVDLAKNNNLEAIAANVPRRYANLVFKNGLEYLDDLNQSARDLIAPTPIAYDPELPCYKKMLSMGRMGGHVNENLPKAQAIKDATMAHSIFTYYETGKTIIHYNGSYHSDYKEGTVWYLQKHLPDVKVANISTVLQSSLDSLDEKHYDKADFIIVVPESMTRTY